jgi:hypothetical protein
MKVILSIPDEGYFERTWWRLFWAYLMKVIPKNMSCALNLISKFLLLTQFKGSLWLRSYDTCSWNQSMPITATVTHGRSVGVSTNKPNDISGKLKVEHITYPLAKNWHNILQIDFINYKTNIFQMDWSKKTVSVHHQQWKCLDIGLLFTVYWFEWKGA